MAVPFASSAMALSNRLFGSQHVRGLSRTSRHAYPKALGASNTRQLLLGSAGDSYAQAWRHVPGESPQETDEVGMIGKRIPHAQPTRGRLVPTDPAPSTQPVAWHALSPDEALGRLSSNTSGLGAADAAQRLEIHGRNELDLESGSTVWQLISVQVVNPMVYLLGGAGLVSLIAGKVFDAVVILLIVVANVIIGVFQEYRAEAALDALRRLSSPRARVLRDGEGRVVDAATIVPG
ncbi:hypothetical protein EG835_04045, partial [bacterium]|nr:hypothetical protein [bacterium]